MNIKPKLHSNRFKKLSGKDGMMILGSLSKVEIEETIWCCVICKVLRPNALTFNFLKN